MMVKGATRTVNPEKQEAVEDGMRGKRQKNVRFCGRSTKQKGKGRNTKALSRKHY